LSYISGNTPIIMYEFIKEWDYGRFRHKNFRCNA
jgi:hypothetical protein